MNGSTRTQSSRGALLALVLSLTLPSSALAGGYIGLDGSSIGIGGTEPTDELDPIGWRFRVGLPVSHALDIEAQLGFARDESVTDADRFDTGLAGVYLKGYLPIGQRSALYLLGGAASVTTTRTLNGEESRVEQSGFSYGLGLETSLTERLDLTADWMRYARERQDFDEVTAVNLGLKLYF